MVRAINRDSKVIRANSQDITDIMRPTAGVIEFTSTDKLDESMCRPPFLRAFSAPVMSSSPLPSPLPPMSTSDEAWNLVPYHISWGHEYQDYHAGKLPGPDGDCIFLRSPTPVKNQRTTEACKKCRERKAKCSGGRPTCARCESRGFACEYASESSEPEPVICDAKRPKRKPASSSHWDIDHSLPALHGFSRQQHGSVFLANDTCLSSEIPISFANTDIGSPLNASMDRVKIDESELGLLYSQLSYVDSPISTNDSQIHGFYEEFPSAYEGNTMHLIAPQPLRRSSLMNLESPPYSSSPSLTSSSDLSAESLSMPGSISPAAHYPSSHSSDHMPMACEASLGVPIDPQVGSFVHLDDDPMTPLEDNWLSSSHELQTPYDEYAASPLLGYNGPHIAFAQYS